MHASRSTDLAELFLLARYLWRGVSHAFAAAVAFSFAVALLPYSAAAASASGLVAAYGFDEGNGDVSGDASGNGNGATLAGAVWTTGRFGHAVEFDGSGALVTINDSASLTLSSAMTLEAWVYPTSDGTWQDVIYKGFDDVFFLEASSTAGGPAVGGKSIGGSLISSQPIPLNAWTHLAGTYDGTSLRLYVDGVEVSMRPQTGQIPAQGGLLTIGGDLLYGQYFQGRVDEVRIYNRALSAGEIQNDMNSPIGSAVADTTAPTVTLTNPVEASTVSHVVGFSADASDDVGVFSVEFFLDGARLGAAVTAPYVFHWNSTTASNGIHELTAIARDAAGNRATSAPVVVSVRNPAFVNEIVVPDIVAATTIAFLPDGRMLVGELNETIWVVQAGASEHDVTPFLRLDDSQIFGEQGLMDILLDPGFATNGHYYIFYTQGSPDQENHNTVSRFTASGNQTIPGSERVLWQDDVPAHAEHHGGALVLGFDGKLYISTGEHFDPPDAQRLDNYRGKILRINLDGSVPTDNPFDDGAGPNKDEIWALGLRNPYRMSIDPVTGKIYVGDVGGNDHRTAQEEVNLVVRGANYGWPDCEGACSDAEFTNPLYSYPHSGRDACVTGGFVYRGSQFPSEYVGSYFFADYAQNTIKRLTFDSQGNVASVFDFWPANGVLDGATGDPVKLIQGPDGSLYYVDIGFDGNYVPNAAGIRRIRYALDDQPPVAAAVGNPLTGQAPLTVAFSSAGSFDPEGANLSFAWTFGDGSTSSEANPVHTYLATGVYLARLAVSDGGGTTLSGGVQITVGTPPSVTLAQPSAGGTFRAGDVIIYSGFATDSNGDPLPASALTWTILFHHDSHIHPGGTFHVSSGAFVVPSTGHDFQGATSYEFILSATNSSGLKDSASVIVYPQKVNLAFDTAPSGLTLELNGISRQTPFILDDVIGFRDSITAPAQTFGGLGYEFVSWSDGGARNHEIVVPSADASYVAAFVVPSISGPVLRIELMDPVSGAVRLTGDGAPNHEYTWEFSGSIENPVWSFLGAVTSDEFGRFEFVDFPMAGTTARFYRTRSN